MPEPALPHVTFRYGWDQPNRTVRVLENAVCLRVDRHANVLDALTPQAKALISSHFDVILLLRDAGGAVVRVRTSDSHPGVLMAQLENLVRGVAGGDADVWMEPALAEQDGAYPCMATGEVVLRFRCAPTDAHWAAVYSRVRAPHERALPYAEHAFVVRAATRTQFAALAVAESLYAVPDVVTSYPVLCQAAQSACPPASYPEEWHLADRTEFQGHVAQGINAEAPWAAGFRGRGVTVAVLERHDPPDVKHPQFSGRVVAALHVTARDRLPRRSNLGSPADGQEHGTMCAGVALAAGVRFSPGDGSCGTVGACGVAPDARLLALLGDDSCKGLAEGDALFAAAVWGADVISCSWGPELRRGERQEMPPHTRWAIAWGLAHGRHGYGCLFVFSAGNDRRNDPAVSMDDSEYAGHPDVLSVGACSWAGEATDYSNRGERLSCVFPSSSAPYGPPNEFRRVHTADLQGLLGLHRAVSPAGDYALPGVGFPGMTSTAAAGAAGALAVLLSVCRHVPWADVRALLVDTCDKLMPGDASWCGGKHPDFGYGRINLCRAVDAAAERCRRLMHMDCPGAGSGSV